jgi:adenosylcobinamide kinase/adenosylcobinamide-phosphate guanylyltransferase
VIARRWSHLILGGARSGKSRHAQALAEAARTSTAYLATAEALDEEMARRIARHRAQRPSGWLTVEEPVDVAAACRRLAGRVDLILVDCVTLWVANRLLRGDDEDAVLSAVEDVAGLIGERATSLLIVSNEVGSGVHPPTAEGLRFQDLLGLVNQRLARAVDRLTLMVAGIPVFLKGQAGEIAPVEHAPEAP